MELHRSVFLIILSVVTLPLLNLLSGFFDRKPFQTESSVWCVKTMNQTDVCRFKNICYDSNRRTLLFFLRNTTIIKGLTNYVNFHKMSLSSIVSHNQFYANISVINGESYELEQIPKTFPKAVLFSRFKPDNIMHSIHDDLLPLFLTLESTCLGDVNCMRDYTLVIHDNYPRGPFFDLYKLFSNKEPVLLNKIFGDMLCFEEVLVGLVQESVFYQYGFDKPHGPVKTPYLTQNDISRFSSYVKEKLEAHEFVEGDVVLVSRKKTRRILNVERVSEMVVEGYKKQMGRAKIVVLDLQSNSTATFIKAVSKARVLIGMHGAEMIFGLFMRPKSVMIELFPFGIQPHVSFVRSVSEIEGAHSCYYSWTNIHRNNSVAHPESRPALGGIAHLSKRVQDEIKNTRRVPPVKCCDNPLYLYYMYQDTWVSDDFEEFFSRSLSHCRTNRPDATFMMKNWLYPNAVHNITCKVQRNSLNINWSPPHNAKTFDNLIYSLYVKSRKSDFEKKFLVEGLSLEVEIKNEVEFDAWISVHWGVNGSTSPDLYFECR